MPLISRAAVVGALAASQILAWGQAGHQIISYIAEQRLSPETRARVSKLLLDGQFTLAQISTCPDSLRAAERVPLKPEEQYCLQIAPIPKGSAPWHYIDIPVSKPQKTLDSYCPEGNCVSTKLAYFRDVLRNSTDDAKRREALMYVVHFMGDIHQPLHCAERKCDQGGNLEHVDVYLKSAERPDRRLHGVWDVDLVDRLMEAAQTAASQALAAMLAKQIDPKDADSWRNTSIETIAWQSWALAKSRAYHTIPEIDFCDPDSKNEQHAATDLSGGYEREADRVIRVQLMKAGVRLADLLEQNLRH